MAGGLWGPGTVTALAAGGVYVVWWAAVAQSAGAATRNFAFLVNEYLASFLASMMLCAALVSVAPIRRFVYERLNALGGFLARRGAFRSDAVREAPKFALIRILFGLFLAERAFWILYYLQPSDWSNPGVWVMAVTHFVAAGLVTFGFATQIAFTYLIFIQWSLGDQVLQTYTLGNFIASLLAFVLMFANAGAHYSLDARILKRRGVFARALGLFYYEERLPSDNGIQIVKLLTLFGYWCVCLYSVAMHLYEPAWTTGSAGPLLLSNNFMSSYAAEFDRVFQFGSWAVLLGRIALWSMMPWYLVIVPFVLLGGIFRSYVVLWSFLFFALSQFVLQLGWLGQFEFLMLAALFWERRFIADAGRVQVFYDDRCNLCDKTVRFLRRVDWFGQIALRPISQNRSALAGAGIDHAAAMADLHAVESSMGGRVSKGYELYVLLTKRLVLLLPFFPVLVAGRYLGGPHIYRSIADRRIRWFGECRVPLAINAPSTVPAAERVKIGAVDPVLFAAPHFLLLGLIYLCWIPLPKIGPLLSLLPASTARVTDDLANAAYFHGMAPINVFNKVDLGMAETWFTLSVVQPDGSRALLPVFAENGSRLAMHRSDRVYFGFTLPFRRRAIGHDGCLFEQHRKAIEYLTESVRQTLGSAKILYTQYHQPLPDHDLLVHNTYRPARVTQVCSVAF